MDAILIKTQKYKQSDAGVCGYITYVSRMINKIHAGYFLHLIVYRYQFNDLQYFIFRIHVLRNLNVICNIPQTSPGIAETAVCDCTGHTHLTPLLQPITTFFAETKYKVNKNRVRSSTDTLIKTFYKSIDTQAIIQN